MCVAILKPAGAECPSLSVLADCWNANKDGAGVAISYNDYVGIHKGFMKFSEFEDWFVRSKLSQRTGQAIVFHFRIGTRGANDAGNTHPFPVSNKVEVLRQVSGKFPMAVAHNGVFHNTVKLPSVSDTGQFMADCAEAGGDPCAFWDANKSVVGWSRLVVLEPGNKYRLRGTWHCVEGSGCMFSNLGWKSLPAAVSRAPAGFGYGSAVDDDFGNWFQRRQEVAPVKEKAPNNKTEIVDGVSYHACHLRGWERYLSPCDKCEILDNLDILGSADFCVKNCVGNNTLYWKRGAAVVKPGTGIMTAAEAAAAGGVAAGGAAEDKPAASASLVKIVRTDPATGQSRETFVPAGDKMSDWNPG